MPLAPLPGEGACLTNNNTAATLAIWPTPLGAARKKVTHHPTPFAKCKGERRERALRGANFPDAKPGGSEARGHLDGCAPGSCERPPSAISDRLPLCPQPQASATGESARSAWAAPGPRVRPQRPRAAPKHFESRS